MEPYPAPINEPTLTYAPGSPERATLKSTLAAMEREVVDVPMFVAGEEVRTGKTLEIRSPHKHALVIGNAHQGTVAHVSGAIDAALEARRGWAALGQDERSRVFMRAAELAAGPSRARLNASTMLGQSKTCFQAEIDAACELVDFLRFNVHFARHLWDQPISAPGFENRLEARPLEGFVAAITPFNFTAIAANLPAAPALLGNTVVWKPSPLAMHSAHEVMTILRQAGLPPGVINLVTGPAEEIVHGMIDHRDLAGVHFTGSTAVFRAISSRIGQNLARYRSYPRLVGETGGKDFVFAHASADVDALAVALVRGAFEYQGQKCSAASRAYVPRSIWGAVRDRVLGLLSELRVGDVADFRNFMGAVIDARAIARYREVVAAAKADSGTTILAGGEARDEQGFFAAPTLIESRDPQNRFMTEEFFLPILTTWAYDDARVDEALEICATSNPYALTGAVFADDRNFVARARVALRDAAGNFYVNDKPTGAVVGQQPFGGGRGSGTNDKAGSTLNLLRWVSPRTVKETFLPPKRVGYPSMDEA